MLWFLKILDFRIMSTDLTIAHESFVLAAALGEIWFQKYEETADSKKRATRLMAKVENVHGVTRPAHFYFQQCTLQRCQ